MPLLARVRRTRLSVESLEARAVPATLVNAKTVTYTDFDGDLVAVSLTKAVLTPANVNTVFTFDAGTVAGSNAVPQQLQKLNLTSLPAAKGTSILLTATATVPSGDGRANVGAIDATGLDLGRVTVPGDLGKLLAGDLTYASPGLTGLTAVSMGRFGAATQGTGDLVSSVAGRVGAIKIASDLRDTTWTTTGDANGSVGLLSVGGDLSGSFEADGRISDIRVGGDLSAFLVSAGNVTTLRVGGSVDSGEVALYGNVGEITVAGSIIGGDSLWKGKIFASGSVGRLSVGGDVVGGAGNTTGFIRVNGPVGMFRIGGSLIGASGPASGQIYLTNRVGTVRFGGGIRGGTDENSGALLFDRSVGSVSIGGDVVGGSGPTSGWIAAGSPVGSMSIAGDVIGGAGRGSGYVTTAAVGSLTVGNLVGGAGQVSGSVNLESAGQVNVRGSILGGTAWSAGNLTLNEASNSVHVGGDVVGGTATADGQVLDSAGSITVIRPLRRLTIDGSVIGGSNGGFADTQLTGTGQVEVQQSAESVLIRGSLVGRDERARILAEGTGRVDLEPRPEVIGSLTILGRVDHADILGGYADNGIGPAELTWAVVRLGSVYVAGDWIASNLAVGVNIETGLLSTDTDPETPARIRSITIGGQVMGTAADGDAYLFAAETIGSLKIGGTTLGPISPGLGNDLITGIGPYGDVSLREFSAP